VYYRRAGIVSTFLGVSVFGIDVVDVQNGGRFGPHLFAQRWIIDQ
jgi:hypothetical protein